MDKSFLSWTILLKNGIIEKQCNPYQWVLGLRKGSLGPSSLPSLLGPRHDQEPIWDPKVQFWDHMLSSGPIFSQSHYTLVEEIPPKSESFLQNFVCRPLVAQGANIGLLLLLLLLPTFNQSLPILQAKQYTCENVCECVCME